MESPLILVVDDSASSCATYETVLTQAGYRVVTAHDPYEGLALVAKLEPDLVLLDMVMPRLDGLAFLFRLRRDARGRTLPVVAASGDEAFERTALARGARTFLRKPVNRQDLLSAIESVLDGAALHPATLDG